MPTSGVGGGRSSFGERLNLSWGSLGEENDPVGETIFLNGTHRVIVVRPPVRYGCPNASGSSPTRLELAEEKLRFSRW